ncbi:MAG: 5'-nucleotidase C-terminal domain-containing protein, partial [Candidatus Aminicenantes bacterium]|nr:5'-nucleotidase C-terminal domain-containing protein [Candidatus Aminicenantes bacterium]
GHSHTLMLNPVSINNVLIVQTGAYAAYLGRIDITIKNGKIIEKKSLPVKVDTIKGEIPEIRKKIDEYNNNPHLNRVFAVLPGALEGKPLLGNLVTDAVREIHHLDIAFHNEGGTRSHRLDKEIRLKDIYTLLPFGNDIVQLAMTPAEIRSLIRYDFERHNRPDLFVSGITYTIKHTAERQVKDIEIRDRHGNLLDENRIYQVGMNDYIMSSYNFVHRDPGKSLNSKVEDSLIEYVKRGPDIIRRIDIARIRTEVAND